MGFSHRAPNTTGDIENGWPKVWRRLGAGDTSDQLRLLIAPVFLPDRPEFASEMLSALQPEVANPSRPRFFGQGFLVCKEKIRTPYGWSVRTR